MAGTYFSTQAIPVRIPPDIHPVTSPAFAILRTAEQVPHDLVIRIWRSIGQTRLQLLWCGRQPHKVQIDAPQQDMSGRRSYRCQSAFLIPGGQEGINRVLRPAWFVDSWQRQTDRLLKRPVLAGICGRGFRWRGGSLLNPGPQQVDLCGAQTDPFFQWRHPLCPWCRDTGQQQTLLRLPHDQNAATITTLEHQLPGFQP